MNSERYRELIEALGKTAEEIFRNTKRGKGNWVAFTNNAGNRKMVKEYFGIDVDPNDPSPIIFVDIEGR